MSGETDLDALLRAMSASLDDGLYAFVALGDAAMPAGLAPRMVFAEAEGTTLIVLKSEAVAHGLAHEFPCRQITLNVHSSLEAVGFMARIATELARHGMGVNSVSGYYHDHLFVPDGCEVEAMGILNRLAKSSA